MVQIKPRSIGQHIAIPYTPWLPRYVARYIVLRTPVLNILHRILRSTNHGNITIATPTRAGRPGRFPLEQKNDQGLVRHTGHISPGPNLLWG